jgi:hypothetical protein
VKSHDADYEAIVAWLDALVIVMVLGAFLYLVLGAAFLYLGQNL